MSTPNGLGGAFASDTTRSIDFDEAAKRGCKVDEVAGLIIETSDNQLPVIHPNLPIQHCVPIKAATEGR